MKNKFYKKLFLSPYYFTIAIGRRQESVLKTGKFSAEFVMKAKPHQWAADPILADWDGKTYLFYEAVHGDKGRIEYAQVREDCSLAPPRVLLEDACHYSYPFVFRDQEQWYMIPESSASGEVRLYAADHFPDQWHLQTVLLREKAVDTTILTVDGQKILLTFLIREGTEEVVPRAYRWERKGEQIILKPLSWQQYDMLRCRGAGTPIYEDGQCVRPAQVSEKDRYGDQVVFCRAGISGDAYREQEAAQLTIDQIQARGCWFDGLHTYTCSERFEAIDLRCRKFDFLKVPKALWNKCTRSQG